MYSYLMKLPVFEVSNCDRFSHSACDVAPTIMLDVIASSLADRKTPRAWRICRCGKARGSLREHVPEGDQGDGINTHPAVAQVWEVAAHGIASETHKLKRPHEHLHCWRWWVRVGATCVEDEDAFSSRSVVVALAQVHTCVLGVLNI